MDEHLFLNKVAKIHSDHVTYETRKALIIVIRVVASDRYTQTVCVSLIISFFASGINNKQFRS